MTVYPTDDHGRTIYPSGTTKSTVRIELSLMDLPTEILSAMGFSGPEYEEQVADSPVYIVPSDRYTRVAEVLGGGGGECLTSILFSFPLPHEEM